MAGTDAPSDWWDLFEQFPEFRPIQRRDEFVRLLGLVRSVAPSRVCEIGTASGGMLCALARAARPDATVVALDIAYTNERQAAFPEFARRTQRLVCLEGPSQSPRLLARVRQSLDGPLDVLLIDGDHAYESVKRDFELYAPLVRPGGLVILHDIVEDHGQRFGETTHADTGGVPRFWREVVARQVETEEIVDDRDQDGYGIGVVRQGPCAA